MSKFTRVWNRFGKWGMKWYVEDVGSTRVVVIASSGSPLKDFWDWFLNLFALPKKWGGMTLHSGFYNRALMVLENVGSFPYPENYILRGYSLGGGVAIILGLMLAGWWGQKVHVETAGAPKVVFKGDGLIKGLTVLNLVYGHDIVATLPPWGKTIGSVRYRGKRGFFPSFKDHNLKNYGGFLCLIHLCRMTTRN